MLLLLCATRSTRVFCFFPAQYRVAERRQRLLYRGELKWCGVRIRFKICVSTFPLLDGMIHWFENADRAAARTHDMFLPGFVEVNHVCFKKVW